MVCYPGAVGQGREGLVGRWVRWFAGEGKLPSPSQRRWRPRRSSRPKIASDTRPIPVPTGVFSAERMPAEALTALLVREGVLSRDDEHQCLQEQVSSGRPVEEVICRAGKLDEQEFVSILARLCRVPHVSLARYQIRPEVLDVVPPELAGRLRLVPLERLGKVLNVGTSNPLNLPAFREVEEATGLRVKPVLVAPLELAECLAKYYPEAEPAPAPAEGVVLQAVPVGGAPVSASSVARLWEAGLGTGDGGGGKLPAEGVSEAEARILAPPEAETAPGSARSRTWWKDFSSIGRKVVPAQGSKGRPAKKKGKRKRRKKKSSR